MFRGFKSVLLESVLKIGVFVHKQTLIRLSLFSKTNNSGDPLQRSKTRTKIFKIATISYYYKKIDFIIKKKLFV